MIKLLLSIFLLVGSVVAQVNDTVEIACPVGASICGRVCCELFTLPRYYCADPALSLCCLVGDYVSNGKCCPVGMVNSNGLCCKVGDYNANGLCCPIGHINTHGNYVLLRVLIHRHLLS